MTHPQQPTREVLEQALECVVTAKPYFTHNPKFSAVETALSAALAHPALTEARSVLEQGEAVNPFKPLRDDQVLWIASSHGIDVYACDCLGFYADLLSATPATLPPQVEPAPSQEKALHRLSELGQQLQPEEFVAAPSAAGES